LDTPFPWAVEEDLRASQLLHPHGFLALVREIIIKLEPDSQVSKQVRNSNGLP